MASPEVSDLRVPPPAEFHAQQKGLSLAKAALTINYLPAGPGQNGDNCITWPDAAKTAFSHALGIWASQLQSAVPVTIDACWANNLASGVLGHAGAKDFDYNFSGAPSANTWYPIALANALSGVDRKPAVADIYAGFSSTFSWYLGTDGNTPSTQYDFVSVVLHEVGHGLGFLGTMDVVNGLGEWGSNTPFPLAYDRFAENASGQSLINTAVFANPSAALAAQLQSNGVYFNGTNAKAANGGARVPLYAPSTWNDGSSYSHLAESFNGTPNALMTFSLGRGESIHSPGPVALGLLRDIGWNVTSTTQYTLSVTRSGTGSGTVSSSPAGINCGSTCSGSFAAGTAVTLTATPASGSSFAGWSGACSGTGTCTVTLNAAASVTASFPANVALTVTRAGAGSGTVTSNPAGINCGTTCTASFAPGTAVTLAATAANGSTFAGWSGGGCSGTGNCTTTINAATTITAAFNPTPVTLTVARSGAGSGRVTSSPAGIDCGTACSANFGSGTSVVLTATASAGSIFSGWSGGGCSGTGTCTVALSAATTVTATFAVQPLTLTVAKAGTGAGTVSSNPAGVSCGSTCAAGFTPGSVVTLTATPGAGSSFAGWSGACSGTGTCTVTMNGATSVTATFNPLPLSLTVSFTGSGSGSVTSSPAGLNCSSACSQVFAAGTSVTLTATPAAGSVFGGWSGACFGTGTCTVTINAITALTATFVAQAVLTPSTSTLAFGGQSMFTTAPGQAVTLSNTGGAAVDVSSISASANFAVSHNCATLAAGAPCTATVTFTPRAEGALTGSLAITSALGTQTIALTGTGERSLVTHYYRSILRRAPDAGGKAFWESEATRTAGLGANVNETWFAMALAFYNSGEYQAFNRNSTEYVRDLYNTFFNRAADDAGLNYWTGQISSGMPREVVLVAFMFSPEFSSFAQSIFGATTVRPEVDTVVDFYRGLLGRLPDSAGFTYWVGQFRTAQCQGASAVYAQVEAISSAYANSSEYAARNRTHAQFVGDLYNSFLRRAGDLAGVQYWIGQLSSGARTRDDERKQFLAAPEFAARVNAIIAQGCLR